MSIVVQLTVFAHTHTAMATNEQDTSHSVPHDLLYHQRNADSENDPHLFTIDTHPSANVIAAGDIEGVISLYVRC